MSKQELVVLIVLVVAGPIWCGFLWCIWKGYKEGGKYKEKGEL